MNFCTECSYCNIVKSCEKPDLTSVSELVLSNTPCLVGVNQTGFGARCLCGLLILVSSSFAGGSCLRFTAVLKA